MTKENRFAALTQPSAAVQQNQNADTVQRGGEKQPRMLGGRVPDSIFREFQRRKTEAEEQLGVRKVTVEEGLEALVRLLRTPEIQTAWFQTLLEVKEDRRD